MSDHPDIKEVSAGSGDAKTALGEKATESGSTKTDVQEQIADLSSSNKKEVDDEGFFVPSPKDKHETSYTAILDAYADNIKETLKIKRSYKTWVFWLTFILLAGVSLFPILLLVIAIFWKPANLAEWCTVVLPVLISFLTVFIVIPEVITKYLFNSEEEKYMSEIIKNIQNYDKENHT